MTTMTDAELATLFADPVAQRLLHAATPARFAYTGLDGAPRVIPIGWEWDGSALLMWTVPRSAKVRALQHDARAAVTIDTNEFPPKVLLVRGTATLEEIEGVPQGYLEAGHRNVGDDQYDEWVGGGAQPVRLDGGDPDHADVGQGPRLRDPDSQRRRRAGPGEAGGRALIGKVLQRSEFRPLQPLSCEA